MRWCTRCSVRAGCGGLFVGALDENPGARRHLECSYLLYRQTGDLRGAALSAIALAQVSATSGNRPGVAVAEERFG